MKFLHTKIKCFCSDLKTAWNDFCADKPSIPYLITLIPLILVNHTHPQLLLPLWGFWFVISIALLISIRKRCSNNTFFYQLQSRALLLGVILGGLAVFSANWRHQIRLPEKLNGRDTKCEAIIRLTDDDVPGYQNPAITFPKLLRGELIAIKIRQAATFEPVNEAVMLRLPEDLTPEQRYKLNYGDQLLLSGVLEFPAPPTLMHRYKVEDGQALLVSRSVVERFNYAAYLANQNIAGSFDAELCLAPHAATKSLCGIIFKIRNRLLQLVTAGMVDERDKNLTAGLLFGFRQGSGDNASKAQYVDSGTIHIFSVSGLHVGILALILFNVLRLLPWRWRYGLVIIILLIYVVSTGANAPAVRAWVMISCFCLSRIFKLNLTPVNAVLWAGVLILYYAPEQIFDIGFQYSFIITLFLLAAAKRLQDFRLLFTRKRRLLPRVLKAQAYGKFFRWQYKAFAMTVITLSAWCGALLVGLLNNGVFCSLSALINLLIAPPVFAAFILLLIKLGFFWMPGISRAVNWSVDKIFSLIDFLINSGLDYSQIFDLPDLPLPIILLLSAGLILLAACGRASSMLLGTSLLICGLVIAPAPPEKFVAIVRYASEPPAVLVGNRRSGGGLAVNSANYEAMRYLAARQLRRGMAEWHLGFIDKINSRNYRNLTEMLAKYPNLQLLTRERVVLNPAKMSIPLRNALDLSIFDNKLYQIGEFEIQTGKTHNEIFSSWCRIIWENAPAANPDCSTGRFAILRVTIKDFVTEIDLSERVAPAKITVFELE